MTADGVPKAELHVHLEGTSRRRSSGRSPRATAVPVPDGLLDAERPLPVA